MFRIIHLITGLSTGGAEMMLYKLLSATDRTRFDPIVVSLMDRGTLGERLEALGLPVYTVGMVPGCPTLAALWRLIRLVRRLQPDLIQGWMYHGNLAALFASGFSPGRIPVLWNIRQSLYDIKTEKRMTAILIRLGARLSSRPARIIYNARVSARQHELLGYAADRRRVIPNGFDCDRFKPSENARLKLRRLLGLEDETLLIGHIARWHPMKDHANFMRAAARLAARRPDVHFVLAGRGVDETNSALMKMIQEAGLVGQVHLLGERSDVVEVTAGLDIASLSSAWGEGFPNVVGEAMACGVPCVVTDVGDSAWVVGDTGMVVPPRDAEALAGAWAALIEMWPEGRVRLGRAAHQRVVTKFSLVQIVRQYEALYLDVLNVRS